MLILGSSGRRIELSSGQFHCPHCNRQRTYKLKRLARYFTLYFIPVFPIENLGEYIECQSCLQTFKPEMRNYRPTSPAEKVLATVKTNLGLGMSLQKAQIKLMQLGVKEDIAKKAIMFAVGDALKRCPNCGLLYVASIDYCSTCGSALMFSPLLEGESTARIIPPTKSK